MRRYAVCYTATLGYLFSTVLSALQARQHSDDEIEVVVVLFADRSSAEEDVFRSVCDQNGIVLLRAPPGTLRDLHPTYARLFLPEVLPASVEEVLYLDGDTQVVADLTPLAKAVVPPGGMLAAPDPMVFIRRTDERLRRRIEGWWDSSAIPAAMRDRYVNAGVLRLRRADLGPLREQIWPLLDPAARPLHFRDQDAINLAVGADMTTVSLGWNFPGFLLGTRLADLAPPRVIHFMSDPRPWHAPLPPWGATHHQPYLDLVSRYPRAAPYRQLLRGRARVRYEVQQRYKRWTERPLWQSDAAAAGLLEIEADAQLLL